MGFGSNGATAVGAANQFVIEKTQGATDKRADYYFNIHFIPPNKKLINQLNVSYCIKDFF
jgi:hypothetical protein